MTLKRFREAFQTSRCKDDAGDATWLAYLLHEQHHRLTPWVPTDDQTRHLLALVEKRRSLVDLRTHLTNQLTAELKAFYPQALTLTGSNLHAPLACEFLLKWPSLQALQAARSSTVRQFYILHSCRRPAVIDARLELIRQAVALTSDHARIEPGQDTVSSLARLLLSLHRDISAFDDKIDQLVASHAETPIFASLPGTGPILTARLIAAFGSDRSRFTHSNQILRFSGIAPVTKQSGNSRYVHRRFSKPHFLHQTFVEWVGQTIPKSLWARAFYDQQIAKGAKHYTALRALAYKWIRIIFRCWQNHVPYKEHIYLQALNRSHSPLVQSITLLRRSACEKLR
jgi:transposase